MEAKDTLDNQEAVPEVAQEALEDPAVQVAQATNKTCLPEGAQTLSSKS